MIKAASEGVRRLALLLGAIGAASWLIFAAFASSFFTRMEPLAWVFLIVFAGICFFIPFLLFMVLHGLCGVSENRTETGEQSKNQLRQQQIKMTPASTTLRAWSKLF